MLYEPFKYEGEWSYDSSCKGVAVNHEDIVAHASVEGNLRDNVHSRIAKLQSDHGEVVLGVLNEVGATSNLFGGHF